MLKERPQFRLKSSPFVREDEKAKVSPKRVIYLSVEGDRTEFAYFNFLGQRLNNSIIHVEVLNHQRGDGFSDPRHVIELLDEFVDWTEEEGHFKKIFTALKSKYSPDVISRYLDRDESLPSDLRKNIHESLVVAGIDVEYMRYLDSYGGDEDIFAVVIDRDQGSHSRDMIEQCIKKCQEEDYKLYLTNPCFEFWLLLHLCDVKTVYCNDDLIKMLENPKKSSKHTFVSNELSKLAHHSKKITQKKFDECYYPKMHDAIKNVEKFSKDLPDLLDHLGSNLPELYALMGIE